MPEKITVAAVSYSFPTVFVSLPPFLRDPATVLSSDPSLLFLQAGLLLVAVVLVFLVLFTLRDILLRSRSFLLQVFCILLVSAVPVVGFLLYLLIRPSRTIAQRTMQRHIAEIHARLEEMKSHLSQKHQHKPQGFKLNHVVKGGESKRGEK